MKYKRSVSDTPQSTLAKKSPQKKSRQKNRDQKTDRKKISQKNRRKNNNLTFILIFDIMRVSDNIRR